MGHGTFKELWARSGYRLVSSGGSGNHRVVVRGSGDTQRSPGRVGGHMGSFGTGPGTLGEDIGTHRVTVSGAGDGSGSPWGGLGRVWVPSGRYGTGRGILREVGDGSEEQSLGSRTVRGTSLRFGTGR